RGSKAKKVLIDHHLEPEDFADFSFWDVQAAATAEIVYELIVNLGDRLLIDTEIANCLYAGIMTDTGGFKHPNTTRRVFEVAADLIELGANTAGVANWIYDSNTEDRIRLLGFSLSERLKIIPEFSTAYISLSAEDLSKFKSQTGDTEGIVNYALSIVGIKFAALITERNNMIKMSFRSMGEFSVNEFARKHFSGGGHKNAAGGKSESSLAETVKKFEEVLKEYKEILSSNDSTKILT
ncbi:MAG: DHHA1 domain-containing protein, partial [Cyclobacteriaceae bacterium]|nr:DHHA1 domain-containing protein [Cyclobacteriaceae bacterium]